jgi:pimeloyl-ACP methyl ester carboxylesterase
MEQRIEKELSRAQLEWIEESGHVPHLEQPTVVAQHIQTFAAEQL